MLGSTPKVKLVYGPEPMREGEFPPFYAVGSAGVTHIDDFRENRGDHLHHVYRVFSGDELIAEMNARHVAEVRYFKDGE